MLSELRYYLPERSSARGAETLSNFPRAICLARQTHLLVDRLFTIKHVDMTRDVDLVVLDPNAELGKFRRRALQAHQMRVAPVVFKSYPARGKQLARGVCPVAPLGLLGT
jgi:hypothetical protein